MSGQTRHYASASLYVGDLHPDVTEAELYDIFNHVGPVASIRVCRDSVTRKSLGYAYVNYHSVADAERALDTLNYVAIQKQPCRLMWSHRDPSLRKSGHGNIFVKNLDRDIDNKALFDTFSLFGNILSCKVATDKNGRSHGFGFVHYETEEAAQTAIQRVNGMQIGSKTVYVGRFSRRDERPSTAPERFTNVYVKHFPDTWEEEKIQEIFGEMGEVTSVAKQHDKLGRPFAFINYTETDSAKRAVAELHGRATDDTGLAAAAPDAPPVEHSPDENDDTLLYVARAQTKAERQATFRGKPVDTKEQFPGVNLYIKNLAPTIDEAKLRAAFETFGPLMSVRVMNDDKGSSKGFGFVSFINSEDATRAVTTMHLKILDEKPLYVGIAEKKEQRSQRLQHRYRVNHYPRPGVINAPQMPTNVYYPGPAGGMPPPGPRMPASAPFNHMYRANTNRAPPFSHAPPMHPMQQQYPPTMPHPMMHGRPRAMVPGMPHPHMGAGGPPPENNPDADLNKQHLGEQLFPLIAKMQPDLAAKITGMMLEMDNRELLALLESHTQLRNKVDEAVRVLHQAQSTI